jgi:hypothetical protein
MNLNTPKQNMKNTFIKAATAVLITVIYFITVWLITAILRLATKLILKLIAKLRDEVKLLIDRHRHIDANEVIIND